MIREIISNDWNTIWLVISLLMITSAKLINPKRFVGLLNVLTNSTYLTINFKDHKFWALFDSILFFNFSIHTILFIDQIAIHNFGSTLKLNNIYYIIGLTLVLVLKLIIELLVGYVFDLNKLIHSYAFQKVTFKNFLGLLMIPVNGYLIFGVYQSPIIIGLAVTLYLLIFLIGFLISFKRCQKLIFVNFFYFILYICTLEIGPFIFVYHVYLKG